MNLRPGHIRILILGAGALLVLYLMWWVWLSILFDKEEIRDSVVVAIERQLERPVTYSDDIHFSLLPFPQVEINNVQIVNHSMAQEPNLLLVPKVLIDVHPISVMGGDLVTSLTLVQPRIELEKMNERDPEWEEELAERQSLTPALISDISIVNGRLSYRSEAISQKVAVSELAASIGFSDSGHMDASVGFKLQEHSYFLKFLTTDAGNGQSGVEANLSDGISTLAVSGVWDNTKQSLRGRQKFSSRDLGQLLRNLAPKVLGEDGLVIGAYQPQAKEEDYFPFEFSGDLEYQSKLLTVSNVEVAGNHVSGKGKLSANFESDPAISIALELDKIILAPLLERGILTPYLLSASNKRKVAGWEEAIFGAGTKGLPEGISVNLTLTSKESVIAGMKAEKIQLQAQMSEGTINLAQFSGQVPGDTKFLLKGTIDESYEGIALRGQLDVSGLNFRHLMQEMVGKGMALPEEYHRFRGRANTFISPKLIRFSEGVLRVEDVQLLGTLIHHYEKKNAVGSPDGFTHIEGAFRLENLNMDNLLASQNTVLEGNALESQHYPTVIRLMQRITSRLDGYRYDLKFSLPEFVLNGKKRPSALLTASLSKDRVQLSNVSCEYNGTAIQGGMEWRFPSGDVPFFSIDVNTDAIDTVKFLGLDPSRGGYQWRQENGQWSKAAFDFSELNLYEGEYRIRTRNLRHIGHHVRNVKLVGELSESVLRLHEVEGQIWNGTLKGSLGIHASKLPSVYGEIAFNGLDVRELHDFTDIFDPVAGHFNIGADFTSAGVNVYSMVQNLQGSLSLAGGGITVKGFNLQNMVRAANAVRSVDDIDKLIDYANQNGETRIQTLRGVMNIGNGFLQTPGMKMTTSLGHGSVNGRLNLMTWDINAAIILYLQALQQRSPPNIKLIFSGPTDNAERRLDTESLESFIARQAAERLLEKQ